MSFDLLASELVMELAQLAFPAPYPLRRGVVRH